MREPVVLVGVLITVEVPIRIAICNPMPFTKGFVIAFQGIGLDERRAMRLDPEFAFLARIPRHNNLYRQTHHGAQHGIGNSSVARTRVQYHLAFPDLAPDQSL